MSDEFLGMSMNIVLRTYFRMFMGQSLCRSALGTCARERKMELSLQSHALRDLSNTK